MVTFVSLFLGLALGPQPVELAVQPGVAAIVLLLDGSQVARIESPPWAATVDLGDRLEPHRLEAIGLDASGAEVARATQWVNLPQPSADARFVLDLKSNGSGSTGRLISGSVTAEEPLATRLWFDGTELPVAADGLFALPPYSTAQLHFVRAEIEFPENAVAVTEATFGGQYAENVSTELTAVPVFSERSSLPGLEQLASALEVEGRPAPVVATEKGPAEVVFVRDLATEVPLYAVARSATRSTMTPRIAESYGVYLDEDQWLRLFWPTPQIRRARGTEFVLFPRSHDLSPEDGNLYFHLAQGKWQRGDRRGQQIADAVAVAGMSAAERNRRRAVVLVIHDPFRDSSQLSPQQARQYLSALRVPLFVWTTKPKAWKASDEHGWGEVIDISTFQKLAAASRKLRKNLDRQRVLWIDGTHLPQAIDISSSLGLELVQ